MDTASMTALSNETSLPTSSVVSVAMLVTWLATVPIGSEAATGATTTLATVVVVLVLLALAMLSTARWR